MTWDKPPELGGTLDVRVSLHFSKLALPADVDVVKGGSTLVVARPLTVCEHVGVELACCLC